MKRVLIATAAFVLCVAATRWAIRGIDTATGNTGYLGTDLAGVEGSGETWGVYGEAELHGVKGVSTLEGAGAAGVYGEGFVGVKGFGTTSYGVQGVGTLGYGVHGQSRTVGVFGNANIDPYSFSSTGVAGSGPIGVHGDSENGFGVKGTTTEGTGIYGVLNAGGGGHAGYFEGRVHVNGTLSKAAGSFRIDHPLEPATKYLSHSFVESPDMKNIYDGVVTLDGDGTAIVELPDWFEALNKDFRYQLTCLGEHAPVYVAEKVRGNRFRIAGGYAGMEVSWQITGTRNDRYAQAHPIPVEETKPQHETGKFLHPDLYGETQRVVPAVQR